MTEENLRSYTLLDSDSSQLDALLALARDPNHQPYQRIAFWSASSPEAAELCAAAYFLAVGEHPAYPLFLLEDEGDGIGVMVVLARIYLALFSCDLDALGEELLGGPYGKDVNEVIAPMEAQYASYHSILEEHGMSPREVIFSRETPEAERRSHLSWLIGQTARGDFVRITDLYHLILQHQHKEPTCP